LVTGLVGSCPIYSILRFKSCRGQCGPLLPTKNPG